MTTTTTLLTQNLFSCRPSRFALRKNCWILTWPRLLFSEVSWILFQKKFQLLRMRCTGLIGMTTVKPLSSNFLGCWIPVVHSGEPSLTFLWMACETWVNFFKSHFTFLTFGSNKLDPRNFKKTKAIFEIRPLPMLTEDYPLEARRQSHMFTRGLMMLTEQFEAKRNQSRWNLFRFDDAKLFF